MTKIEFRNVYFRYHEDQNWIIEALNFTIEPGENVAIIGHNGSGKSTIAKLMMGLVYPQKGAIFVDGQRVTEDHIWEIRQKIGMVFQNPETQFVGTTVRDDVAFGLENRGVPRVEMVDRIKKSLIDVGMDDYTLHEPHHLSGGQKQRVAIAGVMATEPDIVILDEATSMLDPIGRQEIKKIISRITKQRRMTTVSITHDVREVMQADRVMILREGKLYQCLTPRQLLTGAHDWDYLGLTKPFILSVKEKFEKYGYQFEHTPLNHEELIDALWTYNSKT